MNAQQTIMEPPYANSDDVNAIAEKFMQDVLNGTLVECQWVIKCVKRATAMRENADKNGHYYDPVSAAKPVLFARWCRHLKGPLANDPIYLEPWQCFIICEIYGWKDQQTGLRVVRSVYIEVPRKSGKSTLLSVLGIYHLLADGEVSPEVYSAATTRDQAKIVWGDALQIVKRSPNLARRLQTWKTSITDESNNGKFIPLSADAATLEGLNPSFSVVDELHVHKTPEVFDVLSVASGAREQPILFGISTAGTDKEGICYNQRTYLTKVLDGHVEDFTFFGCIWTIDEGDDWRDVKAWQKANPNYGVSVRPDDLERLAKQAGESPSAETNFRTKRLNEWRNATAAWILTSDWEACDIERPPLEYWEGKPCYIGLDLASVSDFACRELIFGGDNGEVYSYLTSYLPFDTVMDKSGHMGAQYRSWMDSGALIATDGNVTDLSYIKQHLLADCERFDVKEIAYDPYGATELSAALIDDGLPMMKVGQSIMALTDGAKELERLIKSKKLVHGNDPVLAWMISNCVLYVDPNDNIKVKKETYENKIDGVIALIMALSRFMVSGGNIPAPRIRTL